MLPDATAPAADLTDPLPPVVDLDIRGRAVVRLVDAGTPELRAIRRQLGPLPVRDRPAETEPDLTIRFVDRLERPGAVRRIGLDAQLVDDAFVLTRGKRQRDVRVEVPVGRLGSGPATIVAGRGGAPIPLLLPMLAAGLLARGVATAHASAFLVDGRGVLVSGWAKGGKSETLLAFLTRGARYVGDEWLFVDPTGPAMFGTPEPIRLWDWQLAQVETLRRRVGRGDRLRLIGVDGLSRALSGIGRAGPIGQSAVGEAARRAGAIVDRQRSRQFAVEDLFGPAAIHAGPAAIDRVVLVAGSTEDRIRTGVDPAEAAARIAATSAHELLDLEALRLAYRHAVPGAPTAGLEALEVRLAAIYARAFADVPIIEVQHRHPPDIANLHRLIAPAL
ncbi:MAG TPA: hypothetical protein VFJ71_08545 [Candidatus Limnocylindrales bacterium]|nr:hypothetical protein [Candidatus Limnocylindrales bacterium]